MDNKVNEIKKTDRSNGSTVIYFLTAAIILFAFLCDSKIFQLFSDGVFGSAQIGWSTVSSYLFNNIFLKINCLLFVLYVFIFRKKAVGSLFFPAIYTVKAIALIRAAITDIIYIFRTSAEYSRFADSGDLLGMSIAYLIMETVLAGVCVVLIVSSVKGFPKKPVLIVMTVLLCVPELYGLISYLISHLSGELSLYYHIVNICIYLLPALLFVTMMLIGIKKEYASVAEAFRRAKDEPKTNRKLEKELSEYEEILEDLKIRLDSGALSQKNYDEMVADINADMEDLKNKFQN